MLRAAQCDQTSFATVARGISPASGSRRCVRQNVAKCATNMSKCNKQHKYLAKYIPFNIIPIGVFFSSLQETTTQADWQHQPHCL